MIKNEEEIFGIISFGGNARALSYESLEAAEHGDFAKANDLMKEAQAELNEAHRLQTKLIQEEINGQKCPISLLMVHAQDHLMTAISEQKLIEHIIRLYKRLNDEK